MNRLQGSVNIWKIHVLWWWFVCACFSREMDHRGQYLRVCPKNVSTTSPQRYKIDRKELSGSGWTSTSSCKQHVNVERGREKQARLSKGAEVIDESLMRKEDVCSALKCLHRGYVWVTVKKKWSLQWRNPGNTLQPTHPSGHHHHQDTLVFWPQTPEWGIKRDTTSWPGSAGLKCTAQIWTWGS